MLVAPEPVEEPDHIELHVADRCTVCGATLEDVEADDYQKRQVFDIPPVKIKNRGNRTSSRDQDVPSLQSTQYGFISTRRHSIGAIWQPCQGDGSLSDQLPVRPVRTRRRLF